MAGSSFRCRQDKHEELLEEEEDVPSCRLVALSRHRKPVLILVKREVDQKCEAGGRIGSTSAISEK